MADRPKGRATWRKERDPSDGLVMYRGVIVDDDGRIVWRCSALASWPRYALRDALHGGPHWSPDGQSNGYTEAMAWFPEAEVEAMLHAYWQEQIAKLPRRPPSPAPATFDPDIPF